MFHFPFWTRLFATKHTDSRYGTPSGGRRGGTAKICPIDSAEFYRSKKTRKIGFLFTTTDTFFLPPYKTHFLRSLFSVCLCLARLIFDSRLTRLATTGSVPKNIGLFLRPAGLSGLSFFFFFFATLFATVNRRFSASPKRAIHF